MNFIDGDHGHLEHEPPGEALRRIKRRDKFFICCRWFGDFDPNFKEGPSCKFRGNKDDYRRIIDYVDRWLKFWHTDHIDAAMVSSYKHERLTWDLSYSLEAFEKLKKDGKIRFCGFGTHFSPQGYTEALIKYGKGVDFVSLPYNIRHTAAEKIMPIADKLGLGIVCIKAFARGSLLKGRDLTGADAGLPRDMLAFVLENPLVDVCICGGHTLSHFQENFSASWTPLTSERRKRLELAASTACHGSHVAWLENHWRFA